MCLPLSNYDLLRNILISVPIAWEKRYNSRSAKGKHKQSPEHREGGTLETVVSEQILGLGENRHEQEGLPIPKLGPSSPIPVITWQVKMLNRYSC